MPKGKLPIKPPYIAALCLLFSWALARIFPNLNIIKYPLTRLGILFIAVGFLLLFWSFYMFRKNKTPIIPGKKPAFIVIGGPYKLTRNPMYLGVGLVLFGAAVCMGNVLSFLGPIIFFSIINKVFIPFEEELMKSLFGKKYTDYKSKVRRWI